jgi:hypothetical protein
MWRTVVSSGYLGLVPATGTGENRKLIYSTDHQAQLKINQLIEGARMKLRFRIFLCCWLIGYAGLASAQNNDSIPIIFDTDFAMPPQDDALALMLTLQSPELDTLGITTVAGNRSLEQATSDVLRMLEIAERADIPVYEGANLPLVHRVSDFAQRSWVREKENRGRIRRGLYRERSNGQSRGSHYRGPGPANKYCSRDSE